MSEIYQIEQKAHKGYALLAAHLSRMATNNVRFSFDEIEQIIGRPLPQSAKEHPAWWANSRTDDSHSWAHLWLEAGWEKDQLSLTDAWVTFIRAKPLNNDDSQTGSDDTSNVAWMEEELKATIVAYLDMLHMHRAGEKYVKKLIYANLATKFGRSEKAFEYRMQNISYVLSLMGREWLEGLKPAKNVGSKVAAEIERIIADIEGLHFVPTVEFEARVKEELRKKDLPCPYGSKTPVKSTVTTIHIARDPKIKAWVLRHAGKQCECCGKDAPFFDSDGTPYLEVHHLRRLADDGSDTVTNAIAICPNCHRELHFGARGSTLIDDLYLKIKRLLRE